MIELLLPDEVACADAFEDPMDAYLFPVEEATLGKAVKERRREFTTGRHLARQALGQLGIAPEPLLPGPRREPLWPAGVAGSITHCSGYRAAVAVRHATVLTVGIDAEPNAPLPDGVLASIALPGELTRVTRLLNRYPGVRWDRLLFSIKESVYKSWFPLTGRWLDFHEADITVDPQSGTFDARLLVPAVPLPDGGKLTGFRGRWLADRGLVLSAIAMPARPEDRDDVDAWG